MKRQKQHENEENEDTGNHDHNQRENKDTLSDLPDCLLIHMLSFLNSKDAVQTCILSSRWKHLWKHVTALTLNSSHFRTTWGFMEFVFGILSLRDNSTVLNALNFECHDLVEPHVLEKIYTASHNINGLRLCHPHVRFSPSLLFSCHSLTSLDIGSPDYFYVNEFPNSLSLNLPVLTYLKLHHFFFYTGNDGRVNPFSTFKRLNTLILYHCIVPDRQQPICISSTTLLNLTIYSGYIFSGQGFSNIELFAPNLCTFALTSNPFPKLFGSHLSSIEQVSIDIEHDEVMPPLDLLNFLIELTNIKSLNVTPTTLEALSLVPDILKLKLSCLCNLKSLNLELDSDRFPEMTYQRGVKLELGDDKSLKENVKWQETFKAILYPRYSCIPDGMIEFLLQNSPSAKLKYISC